jgi:hypothetical protein
MLLEQSRELATDPAVFEVVAKERVIRRDVSVYGLSTI